MPTEPTASDRPSTVLKQEHQVILRVIEVLKRLVRRAESERSVEVDAFRQCVQFFRLFADACHHAKEEDLLFPVLESRGIPRDGGPIGVMLHEHRIARRLTSDMADAIEAMANDNSDGQTRLLNAAREYVELLTNHIFKEDNILFNMGDKVMAEEDQTALCSRFCEVGCRSFGGKNKEQLARLADELETRWRSD